VRAVRGDVIAQVSDVDRGQVADATAQAEIAQNDWAARTAKELREQASHLV
jgi:succinate-semialdehyde dehydrogenase/glutarate-semialdehyde dehydrogenase